MKQQQIAQSAGASSGTSHRPLDPNHYTRCKTCAIRNHSLKEEVIYKAHRMGCINAIQAFVPGDHSPLTIQDRLGIIRRQREEQEKKKKEQKKKREEQGQNASVQESVKPLLGAFRSARITKRPSVPKKSVTIKIPYKSASVKPHTPLSPRSTRKRSFQQFSEPEPEEPEPEPPGVFLPFGIEFPEHRLPPMLQTALANPHFPAPVADAPANKRLRLIPLTA